MITLCDCFRGLLVIFIKMSYSEFLRLITRNTSNKLDDYKRLCRFCLEIQPNGIDIDNYNCMFKQRRDAILENYSTATKQYLPLSNEHPKFVCWGCETSLSRFALFAQQLERNATNWELFLKNGSDVKDYNTELNHVGEIKEIEEIKIEYCDETYHNGPDTDANIADALEALPLKVEITHETVDEANSNEPILSKQRKIDYSEPRPPFVTLSMEFERTCKLCDEPTFSSMARFYKHQQQYHPNAKCFICDICKSGFNNKTRLAAHIEDRHAKFGKTHQCQFCAKLFYTDREVKGHESLHLNARQFVCKFCGKGFNSKSTLNCHMKSKAHNDNYRNYYTNRKRSAHRPNDSSRSSYRCLLCVPSTVYPTAEERTAHRDTVHRKYECDVCKNSFMAQESLARHKLLHSDKPRPFVCTVCNATFNQSSHLTAHFKRKHIGEKTFNCPQCDRTFFEGCNLNAHVNLVHKKEARVKCTQCDRDFATPKYMQKHFVQKHTNDASPYDCKICGKRIINGAKLDQHRLKYHRFNV